MIRFDGVHKAFGEGPTRVEALRGLELHVPPKQLCAVMGPSGAGKSTILHLAAGLTKPDSGTITIDGEDIPTMEDSELTLLRRRRIGMVFQFFNLLPYLSAYDNIALPLRLDGVAASEEKRKVAEALELVRLEQRRDHKPTEMSGGEMQRVAIARALVISPQIVLADEPTGNLDSVVGREVIEILRDVNDALGVTMIVVTHDPVWGASCDRIVRLVDGVVNDDISLADQGDETPEPEARAS